MIGGAKGIGLGIDLGLINQYNRTGSQSYIEPEVLDSLVGVWSAYGMTNDSPNRSTIKNKLSNKGGDFVISNAAYTEGSGYADKDSPYYGAFVTDGVNDLITSTKTVQEMLGESTEFTAVSMIHLISPGQDVGGVAYTNYIRTSDIYWTTNRVSNTDKTGIYGYSFKQGTPTVINNVLGDKNDYTTEKSNIVSDGSVSDLFRANFSVEGFEHVINGAVHASSIAWYWTIIANKVLTTDQINQVIAYFNLDRTLNPDILCNTIKQGITNENHAEFGDKLIDFSGNGRDIQLNNIAWDGDSGIGKYNYPNWKVNVTQGNKYARIVYYDSINGTYSANFKGITDLYKSYGLSIEIRVNRANTVDFHSIKEDGIYTMTPPDDTTSIDIRFGGENVYNASCDITITQIPSHAGALCLDGINDFGKVTGMPIYKDYTVVADREIIDGLAENADGGVALKGSRYLTGAFCFDYKDAAFSFGTPKMIPLDTKRFISYQSKYVSNGISINIGTATDNDELWIGRLGNDERYSKIAIRFLMSFPYSMSEFLIERQLKKHKLGTLYPNMVEFRPVIKSNASYDNIIFYYKNEKVENGTYLTVGSSIGMHIRLSSNPVNEIKSITVNGIPATFASHNANSNIYQYNFNLTSKSPQKIDITIDEYIRYEDIKQPYPVIFQIKDRNTSKKYNWGDKIKVGSSIQLTQGENPNLLNGLYNIRSYEYEGKAYNYNQLTNLNITVTKQSISLSCNKIWLLDDNEPKCILSPRLLRIPNSSYKILGHIPDISGHGNHGKINNSAYAEGSGVNEDGSYQLDGVDDHITIPTLSSGGKQVLMKVNWNTINSIIYDQRGSGGFAIYCSDYNNPSDSITVPAYKGRNAAGTTYIDGIRNEYIIASQLRNVTHNIVEILDTSYAAGNINPIIGKSYMNSNYGSLALYDFMLFDNISTDDKIKQLNEYVGIEAKVELPPYYWDAYGKTNLDADKATIQQRGVAVGDYDLTNTNFAYDKMSGFGGYEFEKFTDATKWIETKREDGIEVIEKNDYSFTAKKVGTGQYFWDFKNNSIKTLDRDLTVKAISNNNVYIRWEFKYRTAEKPDIDSAIILLRQAMTPNVPITVTLPYKTQEEQTELGVVEGSAYYLFYFDPSDIPVGDEYTVEMLPLYTNGLVYDGITDYSKNANIPALDDFTAIIKREWLKKQGCPLIKGSKVYEGGNGNALLLEWDKAYNFVFYKRTDIMEGELPDNISFITPTNYNGNVITRGSEQDTNGICIAGDGNAGFANMVFYKLILYPKTIPLLQINFLKNLMERDEIIDLNNLIFIQE